MVTSRRTLLLCTAGVSALLLAMGAAAAQTAPVTVRPGVTLPAGSEVLNPGAALMIVRPPSDLITAPGQAHTNMEVLVPKGGYPSGVQPAGLPPEAGYLWQTPGSIACDYGITATTGCNPNTVTTVPTGGSKAIAIVDAFDLRTATADLAAFDTQFGLPAGTFTKIYGTGNPASGCANGSAPPNANGTGWDVEEDLDIEYSHAMAPHAHLYLVEAASSSYADLTNAEQVAAACVKAANGGEVSNSWGSEEFSTETSYDADFVSTNVVFFASSGDGTYPLYPATSINVVAVGGTTLSNSPATGAFEGQQSWAPNPDLYGYFADLIGEGAGTSAYEPRPSYQSGVSAVVGSHRGIPDVSADADPFTGVWIYNTDSYGGWVVIGGTSVASPLMAGMSNAAKNFYGATRGYLTQLYTIGMAGNLSGYFNKMDSGNCGVPTAPGYSPPFEAKYATFGGGIDSQYQEAQVGADWNQCGGWGSPSSTNSLSSAATTAAE